MRHRVRRTSIGVRAGGRAALWAAALAGLWAASAPRVVAQALPGGGQEQPLAEVPQEPDRPRGVRVDIEDLAFLEGHWRGPLLGGQAEEVWLAPAGDTMVGMFRLVRAGAHVLSEHCVIEQQGETVVYRFKHILPGWRELEPEEPLEFVATAIETDDRRRVAFNATRASSVRRVVFERVDARRLRVTVETIESGKPTQFYYEMTKVEPPPAARPPAQRTERSGAPEEPAPTTGPDDPTTEPEGPK